MCNLNLLVKTTKMKGISNFLNCVSLASFSENPHSEGFYTENIGRKRSLNKIDFSKYSEKLTHSKYILIHERISTGGDGINNAHPFESREFVLLHNGIFSSFIKEEDNIKQSKSDTAFFFNDFVEFFNKLDDKISREKKIKRTIKHLLNYNNESWSIAIFDKVEEELYYFKNSHTSIHAYKNHKYLYLTTNCFNGEFLKMLNREYEEIRIKPQIIYKISIIGGKIIMRELGKIKHRELVVNSYGRSYGGGCQIISNYNGGNFNNYGGNNYGGYLDLEEKREMEDLQDWKNREQQSKINEYNSNYIEGVVNDNLKDGFGNGGLIDYKSGDLDGDLDRDFDGDLDDDTINEELALMEMTKKEKCLICGELTHLKSYITGDYICDNCKKKYYVDNLGV